MTDYIKREDALDAISKIRRTTDWQAAFAVTLSEVPSADVAPVQHGRWVRKESDMLYWHECSECGGKPLKNYFFSEDYFSSYCPHCGARMDEE